MYRIITLSIHDFQMIFRDKILMVILFIPLIMIAFLIWAVPPAMDAFSIVPEYYPLIVGVICVVSAISPAYIVSFIMLDEKDEGVLTVFKTMPLPPEYFIAYRIFFVLIFGFFTAFIILAVSALSMNIFYLLSISFLISLIAPIVAVTIITYSKNKIGGLTFLKGINFLSILPVLSFFSGTIGKIFFALVPTFWIYHVIMNLEISKYFYLYLFSGLIINLLLLIMLIREFKRKIF